MEFHHKWVERENEPYTYYNYAVVRNNDYAKMEFQLVMRPALHVFAGVKNFWKAKKEFELMLATQSLDWDYMVKNMTKEKIVLKGQTDGTRDEVKQELLEFVWPYDNGGYLSPHTREYLEKVKEAIKYISDDDEIYHFMRVAFGAYEDRTTRQIVLYGDRGLEIVPELNHIDAAVNNETLWNLIGDIGNLELTDIEDWLEEYNWELGNAPKEYVLDGLVKCLKKVGWVEYPQDTIDLIVAQWHTAQKRKNHEAEKTQQA